MRSHALTAGAALGAAALLLSGCTSSSSSPEGGGGSITILCTVQEDQCQLVAQQFSAESGIDANYVRMSAGESVARVNASKANPEFDVWYGGGADNHVAGAEFDLIEPYVSPNADVIPDEFKDPDGLWTGIYWGMFGFCSNTDVLDDIGAEVPQSWDDLLDPVFAKNIAMAHPATSGTAYQALWSQVELNDGDQDAALGYFGDLHRNILQYSKSGSGPGQMAGRGEIAVGLIFAHDCVKFINEGFTNLETSYPEEGATFEVGAVSLIKGAPHPDDAKAFIDWALTPAAQEIGVQTGNYQVPTNPDAETTDDMVDLDEVTVLEYDIAEAGEARDELTARFDSEIAPQPKE
ncbi:ABC transporter substrate-binding protein [Microbacterium sp. gxy059]|uniref:ABC transporter substrate-binding protein n=1 Tax=Microbacterium sp. gxy059 TaxID=2957199 RepID=UPI003D999E92